MSEKKAVTVRIAGEEHTLRANAEPEYTKACARFVDERISEVRKRSGLIEGHRAAILAALSIADEYFQAREALESSEEKVETRLVTLADRIELALEGPEG